MADADDVPRLALALDGFDLPLVMVRLGKVDVDRLTELVTDAWRMRGDIG